MWNRCSGEDVVVCVEGVDPEQLVLDERTAYREAVNLSQVLGFEWGAGKAISACGRVLRGYGFVGEGVVGSPFALPIVEICFAVELIRATFGYRIDNASGRAAILCCVHPGVDRKLAYSAR